MKRTAIVLVLLLVAPQALAQQFDPVEMAARVGIDQHLGESLPLSAAFRDERGNPVQLGDYFGDTPVILSLVYYECPMLCGVAMEGLISNLRVLGLDVGADFQVVNVSIDPGETPDVAVAKKNDYLARYGRTDDVTRGGWHTLTGEQESIDALAAAVGFRYVYDAPSGEYAHGAAVMIITPDGEISRYYYGVEYPARDLRLGLVEAAQSRIGSLGDQVLLLCYRYDPTTGKYGFAIWAALRVAGIATVLGLFGFILVSLRRERARSVDPATGGAR